MTAINSNARRNNIKDARTRKGCVLFFVPLLGCGCPELGQPGIPHLYRVLTGQEGDGVRVAGDPRDLHHGGDVGDRPL